MTDARRAPPPLKTTVEPPLPDELTRSLSDEIVLGAFRRLPVSDQRNFIRWIATVESPDERLHRAHIVRDALMVSPLAWVDRPDLPNRRPG